MDKRKLIYLLKSVDFWERTSGSFDGKWYKNNFNWKDAMVWREVFDFGQTQAG
jgi:hypothetical protein